MNISYSVHAQIRMRQRGLSERDIDLIVRYGSDVRRGLRLLRRSDIDNEIQRIKRRIQDLERLRNCAVIIEDDTVITCYHLCGETGRRALKRDRRWSRRSNGTRQRSV